MADALRLCTRGAGSNCNDSGAAGNVGAYAVQFAVRAGLHVVAVKSLLCVLSMSVPLLKYSSQKGTR
jgi:hypothetical protein